MSVHFLREIERLKLLTLELSALVEENLRRAVRAIEGRDVELARKVIEGDAQIDDEELAVEEECLKILALHQPVAADLRFVVAVLKIDSDLERIGDYAVSLAKRTLALSGRALPDVNFSFGPMAEKAQQMVRRAIDALVNLDAGTARAVCAADDEMDSMRREVQQRMVEALARESTPDGVGLLLQVLSVARHLERIADHAVSIAEDLLYMIEGRIVRHAASAAAGAGGAPAA
jgi:phosphate transport system protein